MGFLGKNLLLDPPDGYECVALTRSVNEESGKFISLEKIKASIELCDLNDVDALKKLAIKYGQFDMCVHFAANGDPAYSVTNPLEDLNSNTSALVNLLKNIKIKHLLYFSSGAVYDGLTNMVTPDSRLDPILPYAISKYASEQYIKFFYSQELIKKFTIVRFFGAYGPHEPERKIYGRLLRNFGLARAKEFVIRGNGANYIDAMYISDAIDAIKKIISSNLEESLILDLGSGSPVSINDLVLCAAKVCNITPQISYQGSVPECIDFKTSDSKAYQYFGIKPKISLEDGLHRYLEWLVKYHS